MKTVSSNNHNKIVIFSSVFRKLLDFTWIINSHENAVRREYCSRFIDVKPKAERSKRAGPRSRDHER